MKKRILSLILCLMMVVSLLPIQAVADEREECANCDHFHWGDAICDSCHLCSADCPEGSDCWYATHCKNCGGCYQHATNWCDECGWCDTCMDEAHCSDCGRCFVGESKDELCENCKRCSDCVGVCAECNLCVECEPEDHCLNCSAHLYGGEDCGYCDDCAVELGFHCSDCGGCFENGNVEHCPAHPDGNHCEDCAGFICEGNCGHCEFEDEIDKCIYCGLCVECCEAFSIEMGCYTGEHCTDDDFEDHFCESCDSCFDEYDECEACGHCQNCCSKQVDCVDTCPYRGTEVTPKKHDHKFKSGEYKRTAAGHSQECMIQSCDYQKTEAHNFTAAGTCEVCGWNNTQTLFFVVQPKNVTAKVSVEDNGEDYPTHPNHNTVTFSVTAVNQAGNKLTYRWREVKTNKKTGKIVDDYTPRVDGDHYIVSGVTTNKLTVSVPLDACRYSYEYYCEVYSKDAQGNVKQIKSDRAQLRTTHDYGDGKLTVKDPNSIRRISIVVNFDKTTKGPYMQGSEYHNITCYGSMCGHLKLPADTRHTFAYKEYLGHGYDAEQSGVPKDKRKYYYYYLWECTGCHHQELRTSPKYLNYDSTELDYSITIVDTKGAYIQDSNGVTRTTAKTGDKMCAVAPAKDAAGNAFMKWQVVEGPSNLTITSSKDGKGEFTMPSAHIKLKAVYDTGIPINRIYLRQPGGDLVKGMDMTKDDIVVANTAGYTVSSDGGWKRASGNNYTRTIKLMAKSRYYFGAAASISVMVLDSDTVGRVTTVAADGKTATVTLAAVCKEKLTEIKGTLSGFWDGAPASGVTIQSNEPEKYALYINAIQEGSNPEHPNIYHGGSVPLNWAACYSITVRVEPRGNYGYRKDDVILRIARAEGDYNRKSFTSTPDNSLFDPEYNGIRTLDKDGDYGLRPYYANIEVALPVAGMNTGITVLNPAALEKKGITVNTAEQTWCDAEKWGPVSTIVAGKEYRIVNLPITLTGKFAPDMVPRKYSGVTINGKDAAYFGTGFLNSEPFTAVAGDSGVLWGDLNGDGLRNVLDIQAFYNYLTSDAVSSNFRADRCDLNGDGKRDVYDLQLLYEVVSGICGDPTT